MMRHILLAVAIACGAIGACGGSGGNHGGGGGNDASVPVDASGDGPSLITTGDGSAPQGALAIAPLDPVLTAVTGQTPPTQQFTATVNGVATGAAWSFDRGELGTIDAKGLFTASGTYGGVGHVTASVGSQKATTTVTINLQTTQQGDPTWSSNPPDAGAGGYGGVGGGGAGGPPTQGQVTTLNGTPKADATVSLLYPYDGTVWPQGLLAPLLQWAPASHAFDSAYVHIQ